MRNLIAYKEDCFTVHRDAVNQKHEGELKKRLLSISNKIELQYSNYNEKFDAKDLQSLIPDADLVHSKKDLSSIYKYTNSVIRKVRKSIADNQVKTIITTCQYCTGNSANTMDHI